MMLLAAVLLSLLSLLFFMVTSSVSAPAHPNSDNEELTLAKNFMTRFGYLHKDDVRLESLVRVEDAIKEVQRFGGVPQTGQLDFLTLKLMKSPRCGLPDVVSKRVSGQRPKRYVTSSKMRWRKRRITYFISNWSPKLGQRGVRSELQKALSAWSRYSGLEFYEVASSAADIIVAFGSGYHGDGYPFDGEGMTLAHAFGPGEGLGGDVHFDADEVWKINPGPSEEGEDFFSVAVHEMGHSLGLQHSPNTESVMFPYYKRYYSNSFVLDYNDIMALYSLYFPKDPSFDDEPGGITDYVRTPTTPRPVKTTLQVKTRPSYPHNPSTTTTHLNSGAPDVCDGHYDSVALLRGELFVFKGQYVWRLSRPGQLRAGYPVLYYRMFHQLPQDLQRIDAAYETTSDHNLVFFSGNQYWVYNGNEIINDSPRPISDFGLPSYVNRVDAVMVWGRNRKTYIFSGYEYWRYDELARTMDSGYPKSINMFRGVPANLDSAMTWKDGVTYFFKDNNYWAFNNSLLRTEVFYPREAPYDWLNCQAKRSKDLRRVHHQRSQASTCAHPNIFYSFLIVLNFLILHSNNWYFCWYLNKK